MTQFDRTASVVIGKPGTGGLEVRDLKIQFSVEKNDSKDPNKATIEIYNLSEKSRNRVKETGKLVYLNAGYKDGAGEENLFIGNVSSINHKFEKPYVITVIEATDGENEILSKKLSLSFGSGAEGDVVLQAVLESFSISSNFANLTVPDKRYANGFAYVGPANIALDKVTEFLELDWNIHNNEIRLRPFDESDGSRLVSLTPNTGLIGSPERLQGSTRKAKGKAKTIKPGWMIPSLLQPKIVPGGQIVVTSREIPQNSVFKVTSVSHSGDTHGSDWRSVTEVRE